MARSDTGHRLVAGGLVLGRRWCCPPDSRSAASGNRNTHREKQAQAVGMVAVAMVAVMAVAMVAMVAMVVAAAMAAAAMAKVVVAVDHPLQMTRRPTYRHLRLLLQMTRRPTYRHLRLLSDDGTRIGH